MTVRRARATAFLFTFLCGAASAQQSHWANVTPDLLMKKRPAALLTAPQRHYIDQRVALIAQHDAWECSGKEQISELLQGLLYEQISLKPSAKAVIVTSGRGCARGGQGSNGAMWLFDLGSKHFKYLGELDGWGPGVLQERHAGYRDVVTGWHLNAGEQRLIYYRFNGKEYREIDRANAIEDEDNRGWEISSDNPTPKKH